MPVDDLTKVSAKRLHEIFEKQTAFSEEELAAMMQSPHLTGKLLRRIGYFYSAICRGAVRTTGLRNLGIAICKHPNLPWESLIYFSEFSDDVVANVATQVLVIRNSKNQRKHKRKNRKHW